jgi:hypothetical protein
MTGLCQAGLATFVAGRLRGPFCGEHPSPRIAPGALAPLMKGTIDCATEVTCQALIRMIQKKPV